MSLKRVKRNQTCEALSDGYIQPLDLMNAVTSDGAIGAGVVTAREYITLGN
jgi:hypothetical protein